MSTHLYLFISLARPVWNAAAAAVCVSAASLALHTVGFLRTSRWPLKLFLLPAGFDLSLAFSVFCSAEPRMKRGETRHNSS